MLTLDGTRFGRVVVSNEAVIRFPGGLVGFAADDAFVLLERGEARRVAYLQSVRSPGTCFPVVDGALFGRGYPSPPAPAVAAKAGLDPSALAILVIVAVREGRQLVANLLAPLVIDVPGRIGAQVVLDADSFSVAQPLNRVGVIQTGRSMCGPAGLRAASVQL